MTNWDDFRYLLAVDDCGSFAGAARRLGVSQPTVSRRVAELERGLDAALFERSPDGARLSSLGRRIVEEARALARQAERISLFARGGAEAADAAPARVRVTASAGISYALLAPLLARLRERRPEVAVDLIVGARAVDVRRGEAEVALRIGDPMDDRLFGRRVGGARFGLYGHESYFGARGEPRTVDDLSDHDLIESAGEIVDLPQAVWLRENAGRAVAALSADCILVQMKALAAGVGLMALPTYLAADLQGVRRVMREAFGPEADVWLLSDRAAAERPEVRAVIDHLAAETPGLLARVSD
ncbi:MAG: LysR family transcriptional regulator [Pseudomonadota bacterium]